MWEGLQRHLECIQDPPDMSMYRVAHSTKINGVDVPYYKRLRGSNSLEGFHKVLPHMIPGTSSTNAQHFFQMFNPYLHVMFTSCIFKDDIVAAVPLDELNFFLNSLFQ